MVIPAQTVPAEGLLGAQRPDPLVRTARGIAILALVLGGLGADAVVSSAHSSADHARTHHAGPREVGAFQVCPVKNGVIEDCG